MIIGVNFISTNEFKYSMDSRYDKFKYGNKKNTYGEIEFATKDTKEYRLSRQIYDIKGQIILKFRVISYKKVRNTLVRDLTTLEQVIIEKPHLAKNIDSAIENAKLQAIYAHFRQKGDVDLINDTKRLKNQVVNIDLVDYMVHYNKQYNPTTKKSTIKFKRKGKNVNAYVYDDRKDDYILYSSNEIKHADEYKKTMEDIRLQQEKNYSFFD
jgi:hypothetical protein